MRTKESRQGGIKKSAKVISARKRWQKDRDGQKRREDRESETDGDSSLICAVVSALGLKKNTVVD